MPQEKDSTTQKKDKRRGLEGYEPKLETPEQRSDAMEKAVDFRGDLTIMTTSGENILGYVFNRVEKGAQGADSYIELYPRGSEEVRIVPYKDIAAMKFSQVDPAAGRSWEEWTKKWEAKKKAQAEGRDIGNIEPAPMPLEDRDE